MKSVIKPTPKKAIIIGVLIVLACIGAVGGYYFYNMRDIRINESTDYSELNADQIRDQLKEDAGLDLDALTKNKIDSNTFKSDAQARVAAKALLAAGQSKQALEAYSQADKLSDGPQSNDVYLQQALAADESGDFALGTQLIQRSIDALKEDSSIGKDLKQEKIDALQMKLNVRLSE